MEPIIEGIRRAVQHAYAQFNLANPIYIVVPPTATAMRVIVRPRHASLGPTFAKYLELAGEKLSGEQKEEWRNGRSAMVKKNRAHFRDTLVEKLRRLEPMKGLMRMRVAFGYVELRAYRKGFGAGQMPYKKFVEMMQNSRQNCTFDTKWVEWDPSLQNKADNSRIDGVAAMKLRKMIVEWESRFGPVSGRVLDLEDVDFKITEVISVITPSKGTVRIEAELDRTYETDSGVGEYQTGSIRLFHERDKKDEKDKKVEKVEKDEKDENNTSDKRIEITTIDVERYVEQW